MNQRIEMSMRVGVGAAIVAILLAMLCGGCSTYRPYTPAEKTLMGTALTLQALDVATTSYALSQPGFSEGNNLWWGDGDGEVLAAMLSTKVVVCGAAYLAGQAWPDARSWLWGAAAALGGGAAAWNAYQVIDNQ